MQMPQAAVHLPLMPGEDQSLYNAMVKEITSPIHIDLCNDIRLYYGGSRFTDQKPLKGGMEAFNGGHVLLHDNGAFYNKWQAVVDPQGQQANTEKKDRISSHYGGGLNNPSKGNKGTIKQYEIILPKGWGCVLFGKVEEQVNGIYQVRPISWFQAEKTPFAGNFFSHGWDAANYVLSGQNIGPKGKSAHTDSNPRVLGNPG